MARLADHRPIGPDGRMRRLEIGIVGAGIGGLAAASLLAQQGHAVTLADQFDRPRPVGSGLVVQPVGMAVLEAIGAAGPARQLGQPIARMLGHAGRRTVLDVRYRPQAPGLAMHRAALFQVLWDRVQENSVTLATGFAVTSAPIGPAGRMIRRADSTDLGPFDLVIDAAGAGSALSPLRARALPFGAVWGHVPWPAETSVPDDRLSQRYQGAHHMAGVLPIGRLPGETTSRAAVFWSLPRAALDDWPQTDIDQWRDEVTAFWPEMAPFLHQISDAQQMTPARYGHGTLARPHGDRLVHIGDAAHRASPQLGQGANMALLDAMALVLALRGLPVGQALPAYARMRRWHLWTYQTMSALFTPMYQSDSRILPPLRDHVLAPLSDLPGMRGLLTALVSGDLLPPLASTRWP